MDDKQLHIRLDESTYSKLKEYQTRTNARSLNEAANKILFEALSENDSEIMSKLNKIETLINENTKASYGALACLSFIYQKFNALLFDKLRYENKSFKYWASKTPHDIFMFFRASGFGCTVLKKMDFWKSFKYACAEPSVKDGSSEEWLELNNSDYSRLVSGVNDANAIRAKKLDI